MNKQDRAIKLWTDLVNLSFVESWEQECKRRLLLLRFDSKGQPKPGRLLSWITQKMPALLLRFEEAMAKGEVQTGEDKSTPLLERQGKLF